MILVHEGVLHAHNVAIIRGVTAVDKVQQLHLRLCLHVEWSLRLDDLDRYLALVYFVICTDDLTEGPL